MAERIPADYQYYVDNSLAVLPIYARKNTHQIKHGVVLRKSVGQRTASPEHLFCDIPNEHCLSPYFSWKLSGLQEQ
jgi:hypothetical protein